VITVDVPVECGGSDHRLVLRIDRWGRVRCHLADHDKDAEAVLEALGAPASACGEARRAVTQLRRVVASPVDRAEWVRLGIREVGELEEWRLAGVTTPGVAEQWLSVTERALVATWCGRGFRRPEQAAPWIRAGFSPDGARLWVEAGRTVEEAMAWSSCGVAFASGALAWGRLGVSTPVEAKPWIRAGVTSPGDAAVWPEVEVSRPDDVRRWLDAGAIDALDAVAWRRAGVTIDQAESQIDEWSQAGATTGRDAAAWTRARARHGDLAKWKAEGLAAGQDLTLLRALGVESPEDLTLWKELGITDLAAAKAWVKAGVRCPADLAAWRLAGVNDPKEALGWVWPKFASSTDEVAAWKAAGVIHPLQARARVDSCNLPTSVIEARTAGVLRLGYPEFGGRPGPTPTRLRWSLSATSTRSGITAIPKWPRMSLRWTSMLRVTRCLGAPGPWPRTTATARQPSLQIDWVRAFDTPRPYGETND
jgi:hypothetical protein